MEIPKRVTTIATPEYSRWYMRAHDMGLIEIVSNTKHAVQWKSMRDLSTTPQLYTLSRKAFEALVIAETCNRLD